MARVIGTASNMGELKRLLNKRLPSRPVQSEAVRLIRKYYPTLGQNTSNADAATLAAEWYSDLAVLGVERVSINTTNPYKKASNKAEFITCLSALLTEAEKYSHQRGYGFRQHFAPEDLTEYKEIQLEARGNEALRVVRDWHTEVSLPPIERFVHRARKIELWQNEHHQLTTLGLDSEDWRSIYDHLFLELRRAVYHTNKDVLRVAYTELSMLLPTIRAHWLPRMDEYTGEEINANIFFLTGYLLDYWPYCDFVPLRPTSTISSQRDPCLFAWLKCHINIKQWYIWQSVKLLAGILNEQSPETPIDFQPPIPKPEPLAIVAGNTLPQSFAMPAPEPIGYPWGEIDALAERIELRANGQFRLAPKWIAKAVAGMIDALREAGIISSSVNLPVQYADFSTHYGYKVGADRHGTTRLEWQQKARKELERG